MKSEMSILQEWSGSSRFWRGPAHGKNRKIALRVLWSRIQEQMSALSNSNWNARNAFACDYNKHSFGMWILNTTLEDHNDLAFCIIVTDN